MSHIDFNDQDDNEQSENNIASVITLPNDYVIRVQRQEISNEGRSIFRSFDDKQVLVQIENQSGKVTQRIRFPASYSLQIAQAFERCAQVDN